MEEVTIIKDQWSDHLLRRYDPYAQSKYEILLDWMEPIEGKSVLVVGCGSGEFCVLLATKGARVHATDIDPKSIELAQQTAREFHTTFTTETVGLENIPESHEFDWVVATDVIEHVKDDRLAVEKLSGALKNGGRLALTVPALMSLFGYHDEILHHFRRYNKRNLQSLLGQKFETSEIRYFGFFLIPVTYFFSRLLRTSYPSPVERETKNFSLLRLLLTLIFKIEKRLSFGLGTSLLFIGKTRNS